MNRHKLKRPAYRESGPLLERHNGSTSQTIAPLPVGMQAALICLCALQIARDERVQAEAELDPLHDHPELRECQMFGLALLQLMHALTPTGMVT